MSVVSLVQQLPELHIVTMMKKVIVPKNHERDTLILMPFHHPLYNLGTLSLLMPLLPLLSTETMLLPLYGQLPICVQRRSGNSGREPVGAMWPSE